MDSSLHILVVDDDREIRDLLGRFLGKHGYRVTTAADGREMAKVLADWAIDLIVLDLMLPGEDGLTLCRNLRSSSTVPVIMLTAMGEETIASSALCGEPPTPFRRLSTRARCWPASRRYCVGPTLNRADARPGRWPMARAKPSSRSPDGASTWIRAN